MLPYISKDVVYWHMSDITSRIVAASGIPGDRYHLGKLIFQSSLDAPDFIVQVDGATGESTDNKTLLQRSIECAIAFQNFGFKTGDVIVLASSNNIHVAEPLYAGLFLGVIVAVVDWTQTPVELKKAFDILQPKLIFTNSQFAQKLETASDGTQVITFDKSDKTDFFEFINKHKDDSKTSSFKPHDFDTEESIAILVPTSGTTGFPKFCALTHKNLTISLPFMFSRDAQYPIQTSMLLPSPLQWLSAIFCFTYGPILGLKRIQTSAPVTIEHMYHLINTYKPERMLSSPNFLGNLVMSEGREKCDFTCFKYVMIGGSPTSPQLLNAMQTAMCNAEFENAYGMTEINGFGFVNDGSVPGTVGKPAAHLQHRLVDVDTDEVINEPNKKGELQYKGPSILKEYYRNPEATRETYTDDGWFKTGDLFYRDEQWNFYFVERIKMMLKFRGIQISPMELEELIRQHPEVRDVIVTGIAVDHLDNQVPVAWVVRKSDKVTAQEIKDLVKNTLSDAKQLRGGVVFLDEIPLTATSKPHRKKLNEMVKDAKRE